MTRDLLVIVGDAFVELAGARPLGDAQPFQQSLAGETFAVARYAGQHGPPTALVTQFGEDAFADWAVETLDAAGLHLDHARRVPGRNGLRIRGDEEYVDYRHGVPATAIPDDQLSALPWDLTGHVFACGEYQALGEGAQNAIKRSFELARTAGAKTIFHPGLTSDLWSGGPQAASLAFNSLSGVIDVLVVGAPYGTGRLLGQPEPEPAIEAAHARGIEHCVVVGAGGEVSYGSRSELLGVANGWTEASLARFVTAMAYGRSLGRAVSQAVTDSPERAAV